MIRSHVRHSYPFDKWTPLERLRRRWRPITKPGRQAIKAIQKKKQRQHDKDVALAEVEG